MKGGPEAEKLRKSSSWRVLVVAPLVVAALALMALGAAIAEFIARPGFAHHVAGWIAVEVNDGVRVEVAAWVTAIVVVGYMLTRISRRYGTGWALAALAVLAVVALFAMTAGELIRG